MAEPEDGERVVTMPKTVIGLFDNYGEAQNVVQELLSEGFTHSDISLMAKDSKPENVVVEYVEEDGEKQIQDMAKGAGAGAAIGGLAGLLVGLASLAIPGVGPVIAAGPLASFIAGAGIGATAGGLISGLTRLGVPENDANFYAEGVRRGGTLVSVNAADEKADSAVAVMKRHGAVEIDKRAAQWRQDGWTGFDENATHAAFDAYTQGHVAMPVPKHEAEVTAEHQRIPSQAVSQGQVSMPVVEEKLEVGKREVDRGGVRVQSRVTETPVEENIQLREEHVHVERRPVDYTFHGSESEAFQESIVEIKEAYEEMIVKKKARVVEEVIVGKEVEQRTETVRETLRRTDVEVEQITPEQEDDTNASGKGA